MVSENEVAPDIIVESYFNGELSFQETIARLRFAGLTDDEIDEVMTNLAPGPDDPDAININATISLMDKLEELDGTFESGVEFEEPFDLVIVDDDGNEATITLIITADTFLPISVLAFGLALVLKLSLIKSAKFAALVANGAIRSGGVVLTSVAQYSPKVATLAARIGAGQATLAAARGGSGLIGWLSRNASWLTRTVGAVLIIDLVFWSLTAIGRGLSELGVPGSLTKEERQEEISEIIREDPYLWNLYDHDPHPAETYGLDYPTSPIELLITPMLYEEVINPTMERYTDELIEALTEGSIFGIILAWLGLGIHLMEIELALVEADYVFDPSSDLSKFLGDYINQQQEQFYQTIMNTLLQDPYLMLELFLGGIALKTLWTTYVPPLTATAFQHENV